MNDWFLFYSLIASIIRVLRAYVKKTEREYASVINR